MVLASSMADHSDSLNDLHVSLELFESEPQPCSSAHATRNEHRDRDQRNSKRDLGQRPPDISMTDKGSQQSKHRQRCHQRRPTPDLNQRTSSGRNIHSAAPRTGSIDPSLVNNSASALPLDEALRDHHR